MVELCFLVFLVFLRLCFFRLLDGMRLASVYGAENRRTRTNDIPSSFPLFCIGI